MNRAACNLNARRRAMNQAATYRDDRDPPSVATFCLAPVINRRPALDFQILADVVDKNPQLWRRVPACRPQDPEGDGLVDEIIEHNL